MAVVFLGLGSNLGCRAGNLRCAIKAIEDLPGVDCLHLSSFYNTAPVGGPQQPDFLNAVARFETTLSAQQLLDAMLQVETQLGRVRLEENGPRVIDLDLLLYEQIRIHEVGLQVPHPRLEERRFVIEPLAEIEPDLVLPSGYTARERLAQMVSYEYGTIA